MCNVNFINIDSAIKGYVNKLKDNTKSSLRSWDNCRKVFLNASWEQNGTTCAKLNVGDDCRGGHGTICDNCLALNLGFYLASWGMLRNSFLREYDHTVHIGAVGILMDKMYNDLFDPSLCLTNPKRYVNLTAQVYESLYDYYDRYASAVCRANGSKYYVSDTLITKIILGVYGCMPAYDTYFKAGIGKYGCTQRITKGNVKGVLEELVNIANVLDSQISAILSSANTSWEKDGIYLPQYAS